MQRLWVVGLGSLVYGAALFLLSLLIIDEGRRDKLERALISAGLGVVFGAVFGWLCVLANS